MIDFSRNRQLTRGDTIPADGVGRAIRPPQGEAMP